MNSSGRSWGGDAATSGEDNWPNVGSGLLPDAGEASKCAVGLVRPFLGSNGAWDVAELGTVGPGRVDVGELGTEMFMINMMGMVTRFAEPNL